MSTIPGSNALQFISQIYEKVAKDLHGNWNVPPYFCRQCKVELTDQNWSSYHSNGDGKHRRWFQCRSCVAARCKISKRKYTERIRAYRKEYKRTHYDAEKEERKRFYARHYTDLKREIYEVYCKGTPRCMCCGETEMHFLTLDHVNGGGRLDRANHSSLAYYRNIIKENFPPKYQVLCQNCNSGKYRNKGICPHQTKKYFLEALITV